MWLMADASVPLAVVVCLVDAGGGIAVKVCSYSDRVEDCLGVGGRVAGEWMSVS